MSRTGEPRIPRGLRRFVTFGVVPVLVAIGLVALPAAPAYAVHNVACGNVNGVGGIVGAMNTGNSTLGGTSVVSLAAGCTYELTEPAWDYDDFGNKIYYTSGFWPLNDTYGYDAALIVEGNGATITRAAAAGMFNFFEIGHLGTVTLRNLTLTGGTSLHGQPDAFPQFAADGQNGGAIRNGGNLRLENVTITNNRTGNGENGANGGSGDGLPAGSGGNGGGISNSGTLVIVNSTISNNTAGGGGAGGNGLFNGGQGGSGGNGGGIWNTGSLTISGSTISGNTVGVNGAGGGGVFGAPPSYRGSGGGIAGTGAVTVTGSLFLNNNAEGTMAAEGGAIALSSASGDLSVTNSTFVGNKAWRGGALHLSEGSAVIASATFTGNDATGTGNQITGDVAALDRGATMSFVNTVMDENDGTQVDCNVQVWPPAVTYTSLGGVTSDENSGCGTNSLVGDPKLAALASNAGPSQTRMPAADSPLLGAGVTASCPTTDQRGAARAVGVPCDIGAVERTAVAATGVINGPTLVPMNTARLYTNTASGGGLPLAYRWSVSGVTATFNSTTVASPQITFTSSGTATVNLNVRVAGASDAESVNLPGFTVKVPPAGNTGPTIAWTGTPATTANEGESKDFTYTVSEPQGDTWSLSAGFPSCGTGGMLVTSSLENGNGFFRCLFVNGPTTPQVKVQVEDFWTSTSSITNTVTVSEVAPTIGVTGPSTGAEGSIATYSFTIQEPGSDTFIPVTTCTGSGSTKVGGSDTYTGSGQNTSGTFQCRLGNGPGTATAGVSAGGGSASQSVSITNVAPSIGITGPNPVAENGATPGSYRYELNTVDPGDKPSLTLVAGSASCGSGNTVVSADATAVVCRFTAGPSSAQVTAKVQDPDGAQSTGGGLTVSVTNVAPTVTVGQPSGPINEGGVAYFPMSATDPGVDTLTIQPPAGCTANFVDTSTPGFISAVLACTYTDGPATVSRTVQVSDGVTTGSVTITNQNVMNVAPSIGAAFQGWDTYEGGSATLTIGGISDPGTDTATSIIINWGDGSSETHALPLSTSTFDHSYAGDGEYFANVDIVDEDGTHLERSGPQRIVVHDAAPELYLTGPSEVIENTPTTFYFTVESGEAYDIVWEQFWCGIDYTFDGAVKILPTDVVQGPDGGSFVCTYPTASRDYAMRMWVSDAGGPASAETNVHVANFAPVIEWIDPPTVVYESPDDVHRFDFHVVDVGTGQVQVATYWWVGLEVLWRCGDGGTVVSQVPNGYGGTQAGVPFDPVTREGYIECKFANGPTTANVRMGVTDMQAITISSVDVTVLNVPPAVTLTGPAEPAAEGSPAVFTYSSSDPANDPIETAEVDCGLGILDSESPGTFSCIFPDGPADYTATVTVSDGVDTASSSAVAHVIDAAPTGMTLAGDPFFDPGVPFELVLGDVTDPGEDTVTQWVVHWGDGSVTELDSATPHPTHEYQTADPHTITIDLTDEDGSYLAVASKQVLPFDHTPPQLTVPEDTLMEGNGTDGLYWDWPREAVDDRDGPLPVECTGPTFYGYNFFFIGQTTYDCWATDAAGNRSEASFTVTVVDTTAPAFGWWYADQINADSPSGTPINFSKTATDAVDWRIEGVCNVDPGLFSIGTHTVHCEATDRAGNVGILDKTFEIGDFAGPAIAPKNQIEVDATGPDGAIAAFDLPTASDTLDGPTQVTCDHESGTQFPLGHTRVECRSTDSSGNVGTNGFWVWVRDVTGPIVTVPADMLVAPTGPDGAIVEFSATTLDAVDGPLPTTCDHVSGELFPIGITTVNCFSRDTAGNWSLNYPFTINVQDLQAPVVTAPDDIVLEATDADGEVVEYEGEAAVDAVDGALPVTCEPASGSNFPVGVTTVTCTSTDSEDNVGTDVFTVSVLDRTAPVVTAPDDVLLEATGASTLVDFSVDPAADAVDGPVTTTCAPESGSGFAVGETTVTCSATDAAGNTASAAFTVTVSDTTAPTVVGPDIVVGALSPAGTRVDYDDLDVSDLVDGALEAECNPVSGGLFAPETTTTVSCSATDAAGNTGSGSFTVTVKGAVFAADAAEGQTEVEVTVELFEAGDYVIIDEGGPHEEVRYVEALGSIVFAAPLAYAHPAGTTVSVINPPPLADTTGPTVFAAPIGAMVRGASVAPTLTCADPGVGVESCDAPQLDTSVVGAHTVTVMVWDFNGNVTRSQLAYTVLAPAELGATGAAGVSLPLAMALLMLLAGGLALLVRRPSAERR